MTLVRFALRQQRHAGHRIVDVPLQPVQIVGEQLEAEIVGHRVVRRRPMRAAGVLIGAKVEAHLFLPKVVGAVDIAQKRQLVAGLFRPGLELRDRVEQQILVAHHHHRHPAAEHGTRPARHSSRPRSPHIRSAPRPSAWSGSIRCRSIAAAVTGQNRSIRAPSLRAPVAKRLCQLRRVDVAVIGVIERTRSDHGFPGRDSAQVISSGDRMIKVHALIPTHADHALEFLQPLAAVAKAHRSGDMVVHRVTDRVTKAAIKAGRIALHVHDRPGGRKRRHVPRRVPGRPRRQLVLFQQKTVGPALPSQDDKAPRRQPPRPR